MNAQYIFYNGLMLAILCLVSAILSLVLLWYGFFWENSNSYTQIVGIIGSLILLLIPLTTIPKENFIDSTANTG